MAKAVLDRMKALAHSDRSAAESWARGLSMVTDGYAVPCQSDVAVGDSIEIVESVFLPYSSDFVGYRICRGKIVARRPAANGFPDSYKIKITSSLGARREIHVKNQHRWISSVQLRNVVAGWRKTRRYESRYRSTNLRVA